MKLTKENIYINLQGKSKEERKEIANYLLSINEKCESSIYAKIQRFTTLEFYKNEWFTDYGVGNKQEVTIQQLKEILQPIEGFTPIAMKCTQEQFEAIKPKLKNLNGIVNFSKYPYLVNNCNNCVNVITNVYEKHKVYYNRTVHEEWNEEIFLKACGIEEPTLTEQLEKAEAEVKRLKEAIEDSRIKVDDWITFNNGSTKGVDKVVSINSSNYNILTQFCCYKESECKKITDQELINKLNELIK